jgi:hypothetical protein
MPTTPTTPVVVADSQGTTFTFAGTTFLAKNVKMKQAIALIDSSSLDMASGSMRRLQAAPLRDQQEVTCEYYGSTAPAIGTSGTVTCSSIGISGNAYVESFELTAAVGELIVGNLTLKLTG